MGTLLIIASLLGGQAEQAKSDKKAEDATAKADDKAQADKAQADKAQAKKAKGEGKAKADGELKGEEKAKAEAKAKAERTRLARQVRKLMRQLDGEELAEREAAEKALIKLGPKILDLLPPVNDNTPAEVAERVGRVVRVLETKAAATATKASLVNLKGELTLKDALAALEKQTGNRVVGGNDGNLKVKLDLKGVSYWEALDQILDQANLSIDPFGGQTRALTLVARPQGQKPRFGAAFYSGLFRFQPIRVQSVRDLRNDGTSGLRLVVDISWEPSTTPISLAQPLSQIKAVDEKGNTIEVDGPERQQSASTEADISAVTLELPFKLPARDIKKIKTLNGTLTALVPGRIETFRFADLSKPNQPQKKAGVSVVFEKLRKNGGLYQAGILVRFDESANSLESHRGWIFNNEAYMLDDKGKRIPFETLETTSQSQTSVGINYFFDLEKDPKFYKFVYKTPALVVKLPVKFQLKDIDLP